MFYGASTSNLHSGLKTEELNRINSASVEFLVVKLQNGKDDIKFTLHAKPTSYSYAGLQTTDYLNYLGFGRGECAFFQGTDCYSRFIPEGFDLSTFGIAFANSFSIMQEAEKHLDACGFYLEQPEGRGYFNGTSSGTRQRNSDLYATGGGDGHHAGKIETPKKSDDEFFDYALTFISGGRLSERGWVFHYKPKHLPTSPEIIGVLRFLRLRTFDQCPEFDFEPCFWRFVQFEEQEDHVFSRNVGFVHNSFDAQAQRFSPGIKALLSAQGLMLPFGMRFIPIESETPKGPVARPAMPVPKAVSKAKRYEYDVAISFAGTERAEAEKLATIVRDGGFIPFFDDFYPEQLWGKDLVVFFDEIYRKDSRYCVIFISEEYCSRMWTNHERRSAQARALEEKGKEYILPIRVDDSELPGMPPTIH